MASTILRVRYAYDTNSISLLMALLYRNKLYFLLSIIINNITNIFYVCIFSNLFADSPYPSDGERNVNPESNDGTESLMTLHDIIQLIVIVISCIYRNGLV